MNRHGIVAAAGNIELDALEMLSAVHRAKGGDPKAVNDATVLLGQISKAVTAIQRHAQATGRNT